MLTAEDRCEQRSTLTQNPLPSRERGGEFEMKAGFCRRGESPKKHAILRNGPELGASSPISESGSQGKAFRLCFWKGNRDPQDGFRPKRTHRFLRGKMRLSISNRMGYAAKICQETVGSFSETNPPESDIVRVRLAPWGTKWARVVGLRFQNEPTGEGVLTAKKL